MIHTDEAIELFLDAIIEWRGTNDHAWLTRCAKDIRASINIHESIDRTSFKAGWKRFWLTGSYSLSYLCGWSAGLLVMRVVSDVIIVLARYVWSLL